MLQTNKFFETEIGKKKKQYQTAPKIPRKAYLQMRLEEK